jgi:hypothetical protein
MYRQIITPSKKNHSINLPEELFGKKIEVIMIEIGDTDISGTHPLPPAGKKTSVSELLETFGADPNFPATDRLP